MQDRFSVALVLLLPSVLLAVEPASAPVDTNLQSNFALISKMLGRSNHTPSDLLKNASIQGELGLNQQQVAELKEVHVGPSAFSDALAFAGLNANDPESSPLDEAVLDVLKQQTVAEKRIRKILTLKQYQRLRQIHNQKLLLSGGSHQVAADFGASPEKIAELNLANQESSREFATEIQKMRWRLYLKAFDEVLGEGTSRKAFGKPLYVDVEYDKSVHEKKKRRNDR